jgi:hypothetical protein
MAAVQPGALAPGPDVTNKACAGLKATRWPQTRLTDILEQGTLPSFSGTT